MQHQRHTYTFTDEADPIKGRQNDIAPVPSEELNQYDFVSGLIPKLSGLKLLKTLSHNLQIEKVSARAEPGLLATAMSSAADIEKEKGNDAFKKNHFEAARTHYTEAMRLDPSDYRFPLNRSIAHLKLESWKEAEEDATLTLTLSPGEIKAFWRRGVAKKELQDFPGAQQDIQAFRDGGGNAIETKKMVAMIDAAEVAQLITSTDNIGPSFEALDGFAIRDTANNNGLGAFATRTFQRGDLILTERPLYTVSDTGDKQGSIVAAVQKLSERDRGQFLSLKNSHAGSKRFANAILGIHATNAFAAGDEDSAASDARRSSVNKIWDSVPYFPPTQTTNRLQAIARAIHLLEEEGYAADADDFTNDAAAICACYSDWASVKYWATKTYQTRVAEFGKDSPRAAEVLPILVNPQGAPNAGTLRRQIFNVRL
ncbi:hypothetical protein HWV62_18926 [Athelia sp. TMB]|nr:hypothetical protein HWV62_18926 [Athelia sp. TMB]